MELCPRLSYVRATMAVAIGSLLMMPNVLMDSKAQPITKHLEVEIRENDYNSLEKKIILRNNMLQPIK